MLGYAFRGGNKGNAGNSPILLAILMFPNAAIQDLGKRGAQAFMRGDEAGSVVPFRLK